MTATGVSTSSSERPTCASSSSSVRSAPVGMSDAGDRVALIGRAYSSELQPPPDPALRAHARALPRSARRTRAGRSADPDRTSARGRRRFRALRAARGRSRRRRSRARAGGAGSRRPRQRGSTHSNSSCPSIQSRTTCQVPLRLGVDERQHADALLEHPRGELFLHDGAADEDLLLRCEERLHQSVVAARQPSDPKARQAVRLRHRRDGEHAGRKRGRHRQRLAVRKLSIGLVDEKPRCRMALDERDESVELSSRDHAAGRVVRIGDADSRVSGRSRRRDVLEVEAPLVLESQLDGLDIGADRRAESRGSSRSSARRRARVRLGSRSDGGDDEERGRGTCGDENVVGRESGRRLPRSTAQALRAEVVAVRKQETSEVGVDAVVGEAHVGERALRKVVLDRRVAELLG